MHRYNRSSRDQRAASSPSTQLLRVTPPSKPVARTPHLPPGASYPIDNRNPTIHGSSLPGAVVVGAQVDALCAIAYHSVMTHDEIDNPHVDPLMVGELISLQEAAEYAGLSRDTLHTYARLGRVRAKKSGWQWLTTHAAVDAYLQSRHLENIPKKYRDRS